MAAAPAAASELVVPGADAVKGLADTVIVEAVLQVVSAGPWTPANTNGLEAALLLQLHFHRDDYPDSLQNLVHAVKIVNTVPRGPSARRLLALQVAPSPPPPPFTPSFTPFCHTLIPQVLFLKDALLKRPRVKCLRGRPTHSQV